MNDHLKWKIENRIGHLVLDAPPSNAMDTLFFDQLYHLTRQVIPASEAKAIVVYGSGRHFSSGADLQGLLNRIEKADCQMGQDLYPQFMQENTLAFQKFRQLDIPVIAAVRGICLGSALELVLSCNIRICGDNTVFGFPETSFNLMPGCGGTQNILKYLTYAQALELILKGNNFDADQALKWGIVHKVVPKKEVVSSAVQLAEQLIADYSDDQRYSFFYKHSQYL